MLTRCPAIRTQRASPARCATAPSLRSAIPLYTSRRNDAPTAECPPGVRATAEVSTAGHSVGKTSLREISLNELLLEDSHWTQLLSGHLPEKSFWLPADGIPGPGENEGA